MRILILIDAYLPHTNSGIKLVRDLGMELRRQGHDVIIVAPSEEVVRPFVTTMEDGLLVGRARAPNTRTGGRLLRAIREERLSSVIWRAGRAFFRENRCDLVVSYSPTIFFGRLVRKLKRLWNCQSYLVLRDIFPQWAVDAGLLRKGLAWRFLRHRELQQYAVADVIGVQSPRNLEYFPTHLPGKRYELEVLYNWTTLDEGEIPCGELRERLGLEGKVVFFYGGNVGVAQDMDNILRLARSLQAESNAAVLIVGDGSEFRRVSAAIAAEGLDNVQILPAVGQREYLSMLREVDVGLISLDRKLRTQNFPGKMLGYMYFGIPILASLNPGNDLAPLLEAHDAGFVSVNGDDKALSDQATSLLRDVDMRRRMGANARRLLEEKFSVEAAARQIVRRWVGSEDHSSARFR